MKGHIDYVFTCLGGHRDGLKAVTFTVELPRGHDFPVSDGAICPVCGGRAKLLAEKWVAEKCDLAKFFLKIVHGEPEHRAWLRDEFEKFWNIKMPEIP